VTILFFLRLGKLPLLDSFTGCSDGSFGRALLDFGLVNLLLLVVLLGKLAKKAKS
jgi:hypothetical protein